MRKILIVTNFIAKNPNNQCKFKIVVIKFQFK